MTGNRGNDGAATLQQRKEGLLDKKARKWLKMSTDCRGVGGSVLCTD